MTVETDAQSARRHVDEFMSLLKRDDNLLLARLVIPDLREHAAQPQDLIKRHIVHLVQASRPSLQYHNTVLQQISEETRRLYAEERARFQHADMYRASILLLNRGNLGTADTEKIRRWLDSFPVSGREVNSVDEGIDTGTFSLCY